jgi:hypothetical protein
MLWSDIVPQKNVEINSTKGTQAMTSEKLSTPSRRSLFNIKFGSLMKFKNQWLLAEFTSEVNTLPTNLNYVEDAQNIDGVAKDISQDH